MKEDPPLATDAGGAQSPPNAVPPEIVCFTLMMRKILSTTEGSTQAAKATFLCISDTALSNYLKGTQIPHDRTFLQILRKAKISHQDSLEFIKITQEARSVRDSDKTATSTTTSLPPDDVPLADPPPGEDRAAPDHVEATTAPATSDRDLERDHDLRRERKSDRVRHTSGDGRPDPLTAAADELARRLRTQWKKTAYDRKLVLPAPIPVRWSRSAHPVAGPIEQAVCQRRGRLPFPALPGVPTVTIESTRAGELDDLFTLYGGLGSGRMAVLGGPGAGKSSAAILIVCDALEHRSHLDDAERARVPVPVFLTVHGWDPLSQRLDVWLADRLMADHPFLRSPEYGHDAARELVEQDLVALFLDGFDEIASELRSPALEAIGRQATFRTVVLTRVDEYVAAIENGHLHGALATELLAIQAEDAATYLERCQVSDPAWGKAGPPESWKRVIEHLKHHPAGPLALALDSPLNLTLLRDGFPGTAGVDELLEPDRFAARDDVENHLLDQVVSSAYRDRPDQLCRYTPDQARRWLSRLANLMNTHDTRNLAWRQMHRWAPRRHRIAMTVTLGVVVSAALGAVIFGPLGQYTVRGSSGTVFGIRHGVFMGSLFGLAVALVSEFKDLPERRGFPWRWANRPWLNAPRRPRFNLPIGLLIGLAMTLAVGNQTHPALGALAGIAFGFAAGFAAARVRPSGARTYRMWWHALPSRIDPVIGPLAGLTVGLAYGITNGVENGLIAGLVSMIPFGLTVGFSRLSADAEISTDPVASWHDDLFRGVSFGLVSGISFGFVFGLGNGLAHGLVPGLVAGTGFGALIAVGGFAVVSDAWRTTLLFTQLWWRGVLPLNGMRFLRDAHRREVLRTVGPIYQFRHARLQERLAEMPQA